MIQFYLSTVLIWFLIYMASGILFYKQFKEAQKKVNVALNKETEKPIGYFKTTFMYLLLCFIPIIRLLALWGKLAFIFNTEKYIELKKKESEQSE